LDTSLGYFTAIQNGAPGTVRLVGVIVEAMLSLRPIKDQNDAPIIERAVK